MQIEKGVPLEQNVRRNDQRTTKYPWNEMESGDSILIPVAENDSVEDARRKYSNSAREWLRRNKPGWFTRTRAEEGGIRVWIFAPENS